MLKIWLSTYSLDYQNLPPRTRSGVLLRVTDQGGRSGYSDLGPWPDFGDETLENILKNPQHILFQNAYQNAVTFYENRDEIQKWLTTKREHQSNNALFSHYSEVSLFEKYFNQGFRVFKLKIGQNLENEIRVINRNTLIYPAVKWRLDGNIRMTFHDWTVFWSRLTDEAKAQVEYVEDPFIFELDHWVEASKVVPIALDFALELDDHRIFDATRKKAFQIYIVKPSRQQIDRVSKILPKDIKLSVTSQLGHLVDSIWSGWVHANNLGRSDQILPIAGTLNHLVLQEIPGLSYQRLNTLEYLDQYMDNQKWQGYENS